MNGPKMLTIPGRSLPDTILVRHDFYTVVWVNKTDGTL